MSTILEEGIGFGGNNDQDKVTEWDRIKDKYPHKPNTIKLPQSPFFHSPYQNNNDLVPVKQELKGLSEMQRERPVISGMSEHILEEVIVDAKAVRAIALENAKQALEEAFSDKINNMKIEKSEEFEVTGKDIAGVIGELEEEMKPPVKDRNFEETKKLITNFKDKVANYPKYISYEGSMVLCVLLSMNNIAKVNLSNLPAIDQNLIKTLMSDNVVKDSFQVKFDDNKDFILEFVNRAGPGQYNSLNMFNSVAHPRAEDLNDLNTGDVPVEKDGETISVGGKIVLNKKSIKKFIGLEPLKRDVKPSEVESDFSQKKQPVAGRNAYEIRSDILFMAIEFLNKQDDATSDDVIDLAKKFYQFVENRR